MIGKTARRDSTLWSLSYCLGVISIVATPAFAQWGEQALDLQAGWNLVWFDVDPVPDDPAALLSGLDYQSMWSFVPGRMDGDVGRWISHHSGHPAYVSTLNHVQGKRGYFIKVNTPGTLTVTGRPANRTVRFSEQAPNLFGARLAGPGAPTFEEHFAHPNVQGKVRSIYKFQGGDYSAVSGGSPLEEHIAYWINVSQDLPLRGPVVVQAPLAGLQFGPDGYTQNVVIEVPASDAEQSLTIRALPAETPPAGVPADASAGDANWLEYHDPDDPADPWKSLVPGVTRVVPAGKTRAELEVRCRRQGRAPASVQGTNSLYQSLVEVTDGHGNSVLLGAGMEISSVEGVWIGQARLTQVSMPDGTLAEAPALAVALILVLPEAGMGDQQLLDQAYVEVDRDGKTLKYRYNAILFHEPVTLSGDVGGNGTSGTLTGTIGMPADHPLNPYRHRYHPEHQTGYAITRAITLEFMATDPDPISQALGLDQSMGDNELAGMYAEVVSGVSLNPITVSGSFKLHRLSDPAALQQ